MGNTASRSPLKSAKVNSSSSLGKSVTAYFPFSRDFNSSVRGKSGAPVVTANGPTIGTGTSGRFALGNGTGNVVTNLTPSQLGMDGAKPRTIILEYFQGDTNSAQALISFGDSSGNTHTQFTYRAAADYRCAQLATYGDDFLFTLWSGGGTMARVFVALTYDGNVTLTARSYAFVTTNAGAYVGMQFNTSTYTLNAPLNTGNTVPLTMMGGGTYGFSSFNGPFYEATFFNRCLTPAEIDRFYRNRQSILDPIPKFPFAALLAAPVGSSYTASLSDSLSASEGNTSKFFTAGQVADILSAAENSVNSLLVSLSNSDTATLSENNLGQLIARSSVADTASVSDATSNTASNSLGYSDVLTSAEAIYSAQTGYAQAADTNAFTEITGAQQTSSASSADTVNMSEAQSALLQAIAAATETLSVADAPTVGSNAVLSAVSDSIAISDSGQNQASFGTSSTDSLSLADSAASNVQMLAAWLDNVGLADQNFLAGSAAQASASDSVVITDNTSALQSAIAQSSDTLSVAEVLSGFLLGSAPPVTITADQIPDTRWIKFEGNVRVVVFEGTGRVVAFEGNARTIVFEGTNRTVSF